MKKALSVFLALAVVFSCMTFFAAAENAVYYAEITSLTAVYDKNTERVEFFLDFEGALLEGGSFVAEIYCSVLDPVTMTWKDNQNILAYRLPFSDYTVEGNTLAGELPLGGENYFSHSHKNFRLRITGDSYSTENAVFYYLGGEDVPIDSKDAPIGTPIGFDTAAVPAETVTGGYVFYTLELKNIEAELSGGITDLSFTLDFNGQSLRLDGVDYSAAADGWGVDSVTAEDGSARVEMSGNGIKTNGGLSIRFKFLTLAPGGVELSVSDLEWGDGYGHSFTHEGFALGTPIRIKEGTVLLGDVNTDGYVDNLDAAWVLKYDAGILTDIARGDVNSDGFTDSLDASRILKFDAGLISGF